MTDASNPRRLKKALNLGETLLLVGLVVGGLIAGIAWYVSDLQSRIVETTALDKARMLSVAVREFRTIYTSEVVQRLQARG